jgi:ubiquinone/menaquinone biosynthesis C-methylase UbiE
MSALAAISPTTNQTDQLKTRLKATWMAGDYDIFSRYLETDARLFFRRLGVSTGDRLLDVGCGSGQLALIAARAGAQVTGCDIATNWIERARDRAYAEGLNNVAFDEADAESLPYEDASFDVVASLVGAMFAPRPDLVAAELTRVCRPGGKIAMVNWTPQGFVGQMFKTIAKYIAPNGMPSPVLWGDEATVRQRFEGQVAHLECTRRFYQFEYPFPPETVVQFFRDNYGPMSKAFASLDAAGQEELKKDLVALWSAHNRASGKGTLVDSEYLEVIAIRSTKTTDISAFRPTSLDRESRSRRAGLLADRIEEGAVRLAAFAERLTNAEWKTNVPEGAREDRTVGTIVHHVASVYPVEVDFARAIASGKSVTQVTPDAVNEMNAKHAREHVDVSRGDALRLLRENSEAAAAAVREFTDEELDRAAPFSLSFGAPVTAQFVLEDHAVRHSWHHLARLRKVVDGSALNPTSQID